MMCEADSRSINEAFVLLMCAGASIGFFSRYFGVLMADGMWHFVARARWTRRRARLLLRGNGVRP
jgi:type IV secretory pathway protease TraF